MHPKIGKLVDRYLLDVSLDIDPQYLNSVLSSANAGNTKKQARLANELTEKDPAISQAWNVRVSSIASAPWSITGNQSEFIRDALVDVKPAYYSGLVSFNRLLTYMQSAILQGFAISQTEFDNGGSVIKGFKVYSHSLFSFVDSAIPFYVDKNGKKDKPIFSPRWIYHTALNAREVEPLRSGLVRPLAWLYVFRRHVLIEYLRGIEKYGLPMPQVNVDNTYYEDNTKRQAIATMLNNWTYDGYMINPFDDIEITWPTSKAEFRDEVFLNYLEWTEKQIFRLILGQDSTSSADNSNRSTAQVHNLVRKDLLASDVKAVEETVNNQIITPLYQANFGRMSRPPVFHFNLKSLDELLDIATLVKTLDEGGFEVPESELSAKLGMTVTKKMRETA